MGELSKRYAHYAHGGTLQAVVPLVREHLLRAPHDSIALAMEHVAARTTI